MPAVRRRQQSLQLAVLSTLVFHICPQVANEWKVRHVLVRYEVLTVALLKIQVLWDILRVQPTRCNVSHIYLLLQDATCCKQQVAVTV